MSQFAKCDIICTDYQANKIFTHSSSEKVGLFFQNYDNSLRQYLHIIRKRDFILFFR